MDTPLDAAKTKWLRDFLEEQLPSVAELTSETPRWQAIATDFAHALNETLTERELTEPNQQKNPRSQVANALRFYNPDHPAIPYPYTLLNPNTYTQLNLEQAQKTDERQTKFVSQKDVIAIVDKATSLLDSGDPNDVAAALAVLIGRRISEILISQFEPCTNYSLLFSEPVKKDGSIPPFEIPTLIEADKILEAIAHLRQTWNIDGLKEIASSERQLKQAINKKYEQVPKAVRRHFSDLIPGREADNDSGEKLYTHVFRSIYAEIATYFYKPRSIPDHRFKAEIQGHFTLTDQGKVRVYTSRPHYDDYLISDRSAGTDGIKLALPDVSVLEVFLSQDKDKDKDKERKPDSSSSKQPKIVPPTEKTMDTNEIMTLLQKQYDLAIEAKEDKYQAIIQGKDALLQEKDARIASLEAEIASQRGSFSLNHSAQSSSQLIAENQQLLAEIERLNQLLSSMESTREQALTTLSQLTQILNSDVEDEDESHNQEEQPTTTGLSSPEPNRKNTQTKPSKSTSRKKEDQIECVDRVIDALIKHNNSQTSNDDKWYISTPVVQQLLQDRNEGMASATLRERMKERSDAIEEHHQNHQLGLRHNTRHEIESISQLISVPPNPSVTDS